MTKTKTSQASKSEPCQWRHDRERWIWVTECGLEHIFAEGIETRLAHYCFEFCPFCGKTILEAEQ